MTLDTWMLFSAAAFLNIISPGPAILLAISNGASTGIKAVIVSSLGNVAGLFILSSISMFGLGVILQTSVVAFTILKIFGAMYLIYLGIKKFRSTDIFVSEDGTINCNEDTDNLGKAKEAFIVAVTNPKAILFFVAFFPIFIDVNSPSIPQFFIMTVTFMSISLISLVTYGSIANSARNLLMKTNVVKAFHRITGGIFIGFGFALLHVKSQ